MKRRASVEKFADGMEKKLQANDHKAHWRTRSLGYLTSRLEEELDELNRVFIAYTEVRDSEVEAPLTLAELKQKIFHEAYDAANFLMMICDNIENEQALSRN